MRTPLPPSRWSTLALSLLCACGAGGGESPPPGDTAGEAGDATAMTCDPTRPPLETARLEPDGPRLLDALGREVILRGANTGGRSKLPPFFPFPFQESGDPLQGDAAPFAAAAAVYLDRVAEWGFDVVRLPFSWEALEPQRGVWDDAWLARYEALIVAAGERDLRVIVDFHQDVFARPYCGDGFPLWACPSPLPETPEDCSQWFMGYFQDAAQMEAFDRFWANEDGLRDSFLAMWEHMVERTWVHDHVVGYEIINEPGNGSADEETWAPGVLVPFYEQAAAAILALAPQAVVLFDATGVDAVTQETAVTLPAGERFVFAPHFYDGNVFLGGDIGGAEYVGEGLGRWAERRAEWQVPMLVGEFGIRAAHPSAAEYIRYNYETMDALLIHSTIWEYSTTEDDWNEEGMSVVLPDGTETAVVAAMVRAYPRAVAGRIDSWSWDATSRIGALAFEATAGGVTEIVAPPRLYPDGVTATLQGVEGCWAWDGATGAVVIRALGAGPATVEIAPAEPW